MMPRDTDLPDTDFRRQPITGGRSITTVTIRYFAALREQAGLSGEELTTAAVTVGELYAELRRRHHFSLATDLVKFAVNREYRPASCPLHAGDEIVFIPPVSGG